MNKLGLICILSVLCAVPLFTHCARHPLNPRQCSGSWAGTQQFGVSGPKNVYLYGSATDSNCNYYAVGITDSDIHGQTVTGSSDLLIVKYNSTGTRQWTRLLGVASQTVNGYAVTTDSSGNIYVTGTTSGSIDGQALTGNQDVYVAKYDASGSKQWVRLLGAPGQDSIGYSLVADSSDNIFLLGQTWGNLDGNTLVGIQDAFLTKYTSSGTKVWTKTLGAVGGSTMAYGVTKDSSGNIYIGGNTDQGLNGNALTGNYDSYIAKYNTSGTLQWVRQQGLATKNTFGYGVTADPSDGLYVSGNTNGGLAGNTLTGSQDMFISKYDTSGALQWTKLLGAPSGNILFNYNQGVANSSGVYVVAYTDTGIDGNTQTGNTDTVVAKYSSAGVKQWVKQIGSSIGGQHVYALGVTANSAGTVFIVGSTDAAVPTQTNSGGNMDGFVLAYDSSGNLE